MVADKAVHVWRECGTVYCNAGMLDVAACGRAFLTRWGDEYMIKRMKKKDACVWCGGECVKVAGIIAEYNPFHNGHSYHIEETRKLTGADYVVAVMSGNFVQRGAPAVMDKFLRTRMALMGGADVVLELPVPFATASAEDFAMAGISVLNQTGVVDAVCFGSECGDTGLLTQAASVLVKEPAPYKKALKQELKNGVSWPLARSRALSGLVTDMEPEALEALLSSPNNILGLEYCKALLKTKSEIARVTVRRKDSGYHDLSLEHALSSASAIRRVMEKVDYLPDQNLEKVTELLMGHMPPEALALVGAAWHQILPMVPNDFSSMLCYKLFSCNEDLTDYMDVSRELADRIRNELTWFQDIDSFAGHLKTRQYTRTRINRALLHILLDIRTEQVSEWKEEGYCPYLRILGFSRQAVPLLTAMKKNASAPFFPNWGMRWINCRQLRSPCFRRRFLPAACIMPQLRENTHTKAAC